MDRAAPRRSKTVGASGVKRRLALVTLGVLGLGAYALADSIEWGSAPVLQPLVVPLTQPASSPVRAAARDLALTSADITRLSDELRMIAEAGLPTGASGAEDSIGRTDAHSLTFRAAGVSPDMVWESRTSRGAESGQAQPALEVSSTVEVYRDVAAAERAFAAWFERVPGTYRLVGLGPWRLPDVPDAVRPPMLASYGGVRPQAAVALVGTRTANVLTHVWVATAPEHSTPLDESLVVNDTHWRMPLQHAVTLAEVLARRTLALAS